MARPRGRPPSAKTLVDRQLGRNRKQPILPAGDSFDIPNLSGVEHELKEGGTSLGTEGSVLFLNSTGNIAEDNSNFFWDDTNKRLGIGMNTPTVDFEVAGTARVSTAVHSLVFANFGSASNSNIAMDGAGGIGTMTFDTSGSQAMHIDANQNVIIGNTTTGDGLLNVFSGSAGIVTARVGADDLVVEHSTNAGISILTPDTNTSSLMFGSPTDPRGADIRWNHDASLFHISTRKTTATFKLSTAEGVTALEIDSSQNSTFKGDIIIDTPNELKGTKHSILLSHDAGANLGGGQSLFLKTGEVLMTTTKALTMIRDGSIVGISVNYDVTGNSDDILSINVLVNGTVVWSNNISKTVADDKKENFIQARGTDTFLVGNIVSIKLLTTGEAIGTIDVNDIICMLEFYYDD